MTILHIVDHKSIEKVSASPITDYGVETQQLIDDMIETLNANEGAGLAAPQLGFDKCVVVVKHPALSAWENEIAKVRQQMAELIEAGASIGEISQQLVEAEAGLAKLRENQTLWVLINPKIVEHSAETEFGYEGCLSIPGRIGKVRRWTSIKIIGFNRDGQVAIVEAEGMLARIFQHEIDHLDGMLYTQRTKYVFVLDATGKIIR